MAIMTGDELEKAFDFCIPNLRLANAFAVLYMETTGIHNNQWDDKRVNTFLNRHYGTLLNPMRGRDVPIRVQTIIDSLFMLMKVNLTNNLSKRILCFLMQVTWHSDVAVNSYLKQNIELVAQRANRDSQALFCYNQEQLLSDLFEKLSFETAEHDVGELFTKSLQLFNLNDIVSDNRLIAPLIITKACAMDSEEALLVLKEIVKSQPKVDVKEIVQKNFPVMVAYFLRTVQDAPMMFRVLINVSKVSKVGLKELFTQSSSLVLELLLNFHTHRVIVMDLLEYYFKIGSKNSGKLLKSDAILSNHLREKQFLRPLLITYFTALKSSGTPVILKNLEATLSLIDLCPVLGPSGLAPMHTIFIALFSSILDSFPLSEVEVKYVIRLYDAYLSNTSPDTIKENLVNVCKDLLFYFYRDEVETAKIYDKIIVTRKNELGHERLAQITFMPIGRPCLNMVSEVIEEAFIKTRSTEMDPEAQVIHQSVETVECYEDELKELKLAALLRSIKEHSETLTSGGDYSKPWVTTAISNLLKDARKPNNHIRLRVARCLGEIGAIDPGKFETIPNSRVDSESKVIHFNISCQEFQTQLLTRVCRLSSFKNDFQEMQYASYAVQNILKSLNIKNHHTQFLDLLGSDVRRICDQYFDTKYTLPPQEIFDETLDSVQGTTVFNPSIPYHDWIIRWTKRLIMKLIEKFDGMNDGADRLLVFKAAAAVFETDYRIAESLMPAAVFNLLNDMGITDAWKKSLVYDEVMAIIRSAIPQTFSTCLSTSDLQSFDISSPLESQVTVTAASLTENQHLCSHQIFVLYETLSAWNQMTPSTSVPLFLNHISKVHLAYLSYACQSYARSLLYLEHHFREQKIMVLTPKSTIEDVALSQKLDRMSNYFWLLQKNYVALNEPDGIDGVNAVRYDEPSLMDRIMGHEATSHLEDALTCCEMGIRIYPDDLDYEKVMVRCLMSLDQIATAYTYSEGLVKRKPEWKNKIRPYMIEAAWKLSRWDQLKALLDENPNDESCGTHAAIGQLLSSVASRDSDSFTKNLDKIQTRIMNPIAATASESGAYLRSYQHLGRLHMLTDIEKAACSFFNMTEKKDRSPRRFENLIDSWEQRNQSVLFSTRILEPILTLQRILYNMAEDDTNEKFYREISSSWLQSSKLARKNGNMQRAYNCLLEVHRYMETAVAKQDIDLVADILSESAKHSWAKLDPESRENAVNNLSRGIDQHFKGLIPMTLPSPGKPPVQNFTGIKNEMRRGLARVKLLHIRFKEEMNSFTSEELTTQYKNIVKIDRDWEKPVFFMGKLYERLSNSSNDRLERIQHQRDSCNAFYSSLTMGSKYAHESLPRLLQQFFDLGSAHYAYQMAAKDETDPSERVKLTHAEAEIKDAFKDVLSKMEKMPQKVPAYVLYTAFSQIISRVNHTNEQVKLVLIEILGRILESHPHQVMWKILSSFNNSSLNASCESILNNVKFRRPDYAPLIHNYLQTSEALLELAQFETAANTRTIRLNQTNLNIKKVLSEHNSKNLLVLPNKTFMKVKFPPSGRYSADFEAFPPAENLVTIRKISNEVTVFHTLAKPKKITFQGTDGKNYHMLLKPKDDLRIDCRTMEFCEAVNRLLRKDPETAKRGLSIRTFTVVPLGPESGLVEWIDGLRDIRSILASVYKNRGLDLNEEINNARKWLGQNDGKSKETASQTLMKYRTKVLPTFQPPVFWDWFQKHYSDATAWHGARTNYVKSVAVMSMVGYIIGLGDRHLENILMDTCTGEVVHCDFACLFNKGELLTIPEVVPFRLTHNMIDAMGPTGCEGHFRKTCEATMRVMRDHREELLSVLKPFVFDPHVGASVKARKDLRSLVKNILAVTPQHREYEQLEINAPEVSCTLC